MPDVLRLLAVSRSGLTANEILDTLVAMGYQENVKVTQFDWLVFLKCIGSNLTESPYGVFNFAHQHLREIVEYVLLRKYIMNYLSFVAYRIESFSFKIRQLLLSQMILILLTIQCHSHSPASF